MVARAQTDFHASLTLAKELAAAETKLPDPPSGPTEQLALGLRGGAAILAVAAFETFLRDLFVEHLSPLTRQPPVIVFEKLPDKVRLQSVFGSLDSAMRGRRGSKGDRIDRLGEVVRAARLVGAEVIAPEAFCDTRANPGPETVKQMFSNLGLVDVFLKVSGQFESLWGRPEASSFISDKLEEIVLRRNAVAHTVDVRRITREQLQEAFMFLEVLSAVLDALLEQHVAGILADCAP